MSGGAVRATPSRHCWDDLLSEYDSGGKGEGREAVPLVGPIVLLAVDLYNCVFPGGRAGENSTTLRDGRSCGTYATAAEPSIESLIQLARLSGIQIIYTTSTRRSTLPGAAVGATRRSHTVDITSSDYEIYPRFQPAENDIVLEKQRASAFFGTPIIGLLVGRGVRTVIICGESTSGCVRATAVDAFSYGFNVLVVEDCVFDRNPVSHRVNLFDLQQKYAEVVFLHELEGRIPGSQG